MLKLRGHGRRLVRERTLPCWYIRRAQVTLVPQLRFHICMQLQLDLVLLCVLWSTCSRAYVVRMARRSCPCVECKQASLITNTCFVQLPTCCKTEAAGLREGPVGRAFTRIHACVVPHTVLQLKESLVLLKRRNVSHRCARFGCEQQQLALDISSCRCIHTPLSAINTKRRQIRRLCWSKEVSRSVARR